MDPGAEEIAVAERPGLADEYEERRLEGILDVARVVQHPPADPEDHRPVPCDQGLEGGLVAQGDEAARLTAPRPGRP